MTPDVVDCFEDDDAGEVALKMEQHQIRRLIVLNRDRRLVGILSLGDLAVHTADDGLTGEVAEAVSEPAEPEDRRKLAVPRDCRRRQTPERERLP